MVRFLDALQFRLFEVSLEHDSLLHFDAMRQVWRLQDLLGHQR